MSYIENECILTEKTELRSGIVEENYLTGCAPTDFSEANINRNGNGVEFKVSSYDTPLKLYEMCIKAELEIRDSENATTPLSDTKDSVLINNFFPFLWSSMELKINGQSVEIIYEPGEADTLLKQIFFPIDIREKSGDFIGWIPDKIKTNKITEETNAEQFVTNNKGRDRRKDLYNDTKEFTIYWYFSPLFGFSEYRKLLYNIPFSLILKRQVDNKLIFDKDPGHVHIRSLELLVPYVRLENKVKAFFLKQINENDTFECVFKKREGIQIQEISATTGKQQIRLFNTSNSPKYIIIAFKTNDERSGYFSKYGVTQIQLSVGNTNYPSDPIKVSYKGMIDVVGVYDLYRKMCKNFGILPQLSMVEFIQSPFYCFDVSKRNPEIVLNGAQVTLKVNKTSPKTAKIHILSLENSFWKIKNENGKMSCISMKE